MIEIPRGDEERHALGGLALVIELQCHEVEGRLDPFAGARGTPLERLRRREPAVTGLAGLDDAQGAVGLKRGGCSGRVEFHWRSAAGEIVAGRGGGPASGEPAGTGEIIAEENFARGPMVAQPRGEIRAEFLGFVVERGFERLPAFSFAGQRGFDDAVLGRDPFLDVEGG